MNRHSHFFCTENSQDTQLSCFHLDQLPVSVVDSQDCNTKEKQHKPYYIKRYQININILTIHNFNFFKLLTYIAVNTQ